MTLRLSSTHPRIGLLALTGTGNAVLRALSEAGHAPALVVTREERGPYPYYDERSLADEAASLGLPCAYGAKGEAELVRKPLDMLIAATYHRLLGPALISAIPLSVNLHPSLLPRYRGPNPWFWVLRNGETLTGVSAHLLTSDVDEGDLLWQQELRIAEDETQGSLRRRTALLSARAAIDLLHLAVTIGLEPRPQDAAAASLFPKPSDRDREIRAGMSVREVCTLVRALAPFPGALYRGRTVIAAHPAGAGWAREIVEEEGVRTAEAAVVNGRFKDGVVELTFGRR